MVADFFAAPIQRSAPTLYTINDAQTITTNRDRAEGSFALDDIEHSLVAAVGLEPTTYGL